MTLFEHKTAIIKWIRSSETAEQLDLLEKFIAGYVLTRFEKEAEVLKDQEKKNLEYELNTTSADLRHAILDRKLILASGF
jgi:hypothetical protein